LQLFRVVHVVVQPKVEDVRGQDCRHAVVNRFNQLVCGGGQDDRIKKLRKLFLS
jgi:hypothetical protein